MQLLIIMFMIFMISLLMMLINFLIKKKMISDQEKSPFECGFDSLSNNHTPFSIHFFIISLIFLIFDIEITLFIPLVYLTKIYNHNIIIYSSYLFFLLIYGLYMEYLEYSIDWKL